MYQTDFLYGQEADMFSFIEVPVLLFTDSRFSSVSFGAKFLYSILLKEIEPALSNGWIDEEGHVFVIYPIADAMKFMNISKKKAMGFMTELSDIGLITRKKRGNRKPDAIYVMNYAS